MSATTVVARTHPSDAPILHARQLIVQAIRRRWDKGLLTRDPDGVFTAFLGAPQIDRLIAEPVDAPAGEPASEMVVDGAEPLGRLAAALSLSARQVDLVAVLLACEIDPVTTRLITYLGGNQSQFTANADLMLEIVYGPRERGTMAASALMLADLGPHAALGRYGIVVVDGQDGRSSLASGVRLHARIVQLLVEDARFDPGLVGVARLVAPDEPHAECSAESVAAVVAALGARDRLVLLEGMAGSGREIVMRAAAAAVGRPLLVVNGRGIDDERLVAAFREARLHSALLAIRDADELLEGTRLGALRQRITGFPDTIALIGSRHLAPLCHGLRPLTVVPVTLPPPDERIRLWREQLGADNGLSDEELRLTAGLYNLGIGGIGEVVQTAREAAALSGGPIVRRHLGESVRELFDADLSSIALRVEVTQEWGDLVLPDDLEQAITGIIDRIQYRGEVLGKWGFARKLGKGLGLTVLFSGEPGTGKSMVAGLIARQLGLDLYSIDLSRITSKWIGETEKNLARAFDAAEAGHVLLLFDEADSVLGRRTSDVRSSNDRNANLETNFILTRLEQFQGVAIFTTNLASAIDPAVSRRMAVHVNFPFPDADSRTELWRRLIPSQAPVEEEIDFKELARRFELSGGYIRNIVLRAAYLAARARESIGMSHLESAAEMEYRERGALHVGGRLT